MSGYDRVNYPQAEKRVFLKGKILLALVALSVFLGAFFSCTSPVVQSSNSGDLLLDVQIGGVSRTLLPSFTEEVTGFALTLEQDQSLSETYAFSSDEALLVSDLALGTYQVSLEALSTTGEVILSGSASVEISSGENNLTISLIPLSSGNGAVEIEIVVPSGTAQFAYSFGPRGAAPVYTQVPLGVENFWTLSQDNLPAGFYDLHVMVGSRVATEVVWVYPNVVTRDSMRILTGDSGNLEITLIIEDPEETDPVLSSLPETISENFTILVGITNGSNYQWLIDGELQSNSASFTIDPNSLTEGYHVLTLIFEVDGRPYSKSVSFQSEAGIILPEPPIIILPPLPHSNPLTVELDGRGTGDVYYSLDGSHPDLLYTEPLSVYLPATIMARTVNAHGVSETTTMNLDAPFQGITVYVKGYSNIYYWATEPAGAVPEVEWANSPTMTDIGDGVMEYVFPGVSSTNLIFRNPGQTGDLSRTTGTWWWDGDQWHDTNIFGPVIPEVSSDPPGGVFDAAAQTVTLSSSNQDDVIYYTSDGSDPKTNGSIYEWSLTVSGEKTIRAYAVNSLGQEGPESSWDFNVSTGNDVIPPNISASHEPGNYAEPIPEFTLFVTDAESSSQAWYTTDSSAGNHHENWIPFSGNTSFPITENTHVRVYALDAAGNDSNRNFFITIGQRERTDFREESIYFLLTARFYDGDASNNRYTRYAENNGNAANNDPAWRGDFKGLIEKLDYIKALGFSAIWITPPVLNRSDYDYHGYHAWDMRVIDARLESPGASYQDLIDAVHARDMKIIQDVVFNHSGRYGLNEVAPVRFWGDSNDPEWGDGTEIDYYDVENPDFVYNGLDIEPISGKNYYNGDLWQTAPPNLAWDADLSAWGTPTQWRSPEGYVVYNFQWATEIAVQNLFDPAYFHGEFLKNWEDYTCQTGSIHEDCIDIDTESAVAQEYLIDAYNRYIDMGVDAFRVDTAKHISRVMFNRRFVPAFKERGGDNFYMFGEVLTKVHEIWNKGVAPLSGPFYTWQERTTYSADDTLAAKEGYDYEYARGVNDQPTSDNHYLDGNNYRTPDYSQASDFAVIDMGMHMNFSDAGQAWNMRSGDHWYNDATWNVVYVDSHDYGPSTSGQRYASGSTAWAENAALMFTFRGIPTIYYGSEIEFQAGVDIDPNPAVTPLSETGRAYFGDEISGSVEVQDFGVWNNATGNMANALNHPLARNFSRLNRIRRAIPALQKGQYSTDDVSGNIAFKRRYTDETTDSFVLVAISQGATFNNIPNGTYTDAVTGDVQNVSSGSLTINLSGQGNLRAYVLDTALTPAPGKIGEDTQWLK